MSPKSESVPADVFGATEGVVATPVTGLCQPRADVQPMKDISLAFKSPATEMHLPESFSHAMSADLLTFVSMELSFVDNDHEAPPHIPTFHEGVRSEVFPM
ncbi:MAG: hypothetical protein DDT19_02225 [Syntrophomonadaceae bacterium]|nr:hypothetical protein [Bacillota bacterium]